MGKIINKKEALPIKNIWNLARRYSEIYIIKYIVLIGFSVLTNFIILNSCQGLITSAFTFIVMLAFDQKIVNLKYKRDKSRVYEKNFFGNTFFYLLIIIIVTLFIVLFQEMQSKGIEKNLGELACKVIMFLLSVLASTSALFEAIAYIPEQALLKQQEKIEPKYIERREGE